MAQSTLITDETKSGSPWQQALVGVLGVVLALILVGGQVSVATTRGISQNMEQLNANLEEGNEVMFEIIKKSAPAVVMEKVVKAQSGTLEHTRDSLVLMNQELDAIALATDDLQMQTSSMSATAGSVAGSVDAMQSDTASVTGTLGTLPDTTGNAAGSLTRIKDDSADINAELGAVSGKLESYGLPRAQGDQP